MNCKYNKGNELSFVALQVSKDVRLYTRKVFSCTSIDFDCITLIYE